jgi:hypothetical protein
MGVFQIKNLVNGKLFIGRGMNVQGEAQQCKIPIGAGLASQPGNAE